MKVLINNKQAAKNICDCKFLKSLIGLRFRKSFQPYDCFIIYMAPDSVLDSFFVNFEFYAAWVNQQGRVIKFEICRQKKLFAPVIGQARVYEFPAEKKLKIKIGDKIEVKI